MKPRRVFVLLYAASGAAALIYEVTWTRLLTLQLGHKLDPRWGYSAVPASATVAIQVAEAPSRAADALDDKLKKLLG